MNRHQQEKQSQSFEKSKTDIVNEDDDFFRELDEKANSIENNEAEILKLKEENNRVAAELSSITSENTTLRNEKQQLIEVISQLESQLEAVKREQNDYSRASPRASDSFDSMVNNVAELEK